MIVVGQVIVEERDEEKGPQARSAESMGGAENQMRMCSLHSLTCLQVKFVPRQCLDLLPTTPNSFSRNPEAPVTSLSQ
jgi:hypothetical protein